MGAEYGLASVAGFVLAVFFDWFPWVREKFDLLTVQGKKLVMLAALVLVSGVSFGLACVPSSPLHVVECTDAGAWQMVGMFLTALVTNQGGHSLLKPASE